MSTSFRLTWSMANTPWSVVQVWVTQLNCSGAHPRAVDSPKERIHRLFMAHPPDLLSLRIPIGSPRNALLAEDPISCRADGLIFQNPPLREEFKYYPNP